MARHKISGGSGPLSGIPGLHKANRREGAELGRRSYGDRQWSHRFRPGKLELGLWRCGTLLGRSPRKGSTNCGRRWQGRQWKRLCSAPELKEEEWNGENRQGLDEDYLNTRLSGSKPGVSGLFRIDTWRFRVHNNPEDQIEVEPTRFGQKLKLSHCNLKFNPIQL